MEKMPDRHKYADDDPTMFTECETCGELYDMESYCSPCFIKRRTRELRGEQQEILKDIAKSIELIGESILGKKQA